MHVLVLGMAYASFDRLVDSSEWSNTIAQLAVLMLIWGMVKTRFLYRVVPR
jgi:hypothetical protein